jgi:hypothetical protein
MEDFITKMEDRSMSVRNRKGDVIRGQGAELTELQDEFMSRVREEGIDKAPVIARDLNYTSYYRDRRNVGTAFHKELMKFVNEESSQIESAKGTNLSMLVQIRDTALATGDMKAAMEAIKVINDMQGHKAPTKVQNTKLDIKATIDLTAPQEDSEYLDI